LELSSVLVTVTLLFSMDPLAALAALEIANGIDPMAAADGDPPLVAVNHFGDVLALNQVGQTFLDPLLLATSAVIFPAAVNATEAQQQFLLGNVRVQRSMVLADMYIVLPLGLEGAFTFNAVATTPQWALFRVVETNGPTSITLRFVGATPADQAAALAGPLIVNHAYTVTPTAYFIKPLALFLAAFQHLIDAAEVALQPVPVAPIPLPGGAPDTLATALATALLGRNPNATPISQVNADRLRKAFSVRGLFADPRVFYALFFADYVYLPDGPPPAASDLRWENMIELARNQIIGERMLETMFLDFSEKKIIGTVTFNFGDDQAGSISVADFHPPGRPVTNAAALNQAFALIGDIYARIFGASFRTAIMVLSSSLQTLLTRYPGLRLIDAITLANIRLRRLPAEVASIAQPAPPLHETLVQLLTFQPDDKMVTDHLLRQVHSTSAPTYPSRHATHVRAPGRPNSRSRVTRSSTPAPQAKSAAPRRPAETARTGADNSAYGAWMAQKPALPGDEPCFAFLRGRGACQNTTVCRGIGKERKVRPHAFSPTVTPAQQQTFMAWLNAQPAQG
jgi:hypothetical protein